MDAAVSDGDSCTAKIIRLWSLDLTKKLLDLEEKEMKRKS